MLLSISKSGKSRFSNDSFHYKHLWSRPLDTNKVRPDSSLESKSRRALKRAYRPVKASPPDPLS